MPVAAADEVVAARRALHAACAAQKPGADAAIEQRAGQLRRPAACRIEPAATRILVAATGLRTHAMMRQQVLVAVDADQVLQRQGDARLLVGLELRKVHHQIRLQYRLREQVLVASIDVVMGRRHGVIVGAAKAGGVEARIRERAARTEIDQAIAARVARQRRALHDDSVAVDHTLAAQVQHVQRPSGVRVELFQRVESHGHADCGEVAVVLGRFGDTHASLRADCKPGIVDRRAQHGAVGDDRVERAGLARVPVADEVRLEHHVAAATHQRAQRVPLLRAEAFGVQAEGLQRRAHCVVDMIRRRVGALQHRVELGVTPPGVPGGFQPGVTRPGARESDANHGAFLPTSDFTARNFPFGSRAMLFTSSMRMSISSPSRERI